MNQKSASNVTINSDEWNSVNKGDRKKIEQIISENFDGTKVVPELNAKKSSEIVPNATISSAANTACTAVEAAAIAACNALPFPGNAVCIGIAHEAANKCRQANP